MVTIEVFIQSQNIKEVILSKKVSKEKAAEFLGAKPDPAPKKASRKGIKNVPPKKEKYMTPAEMFVHFQAFRVKREQDPFLIEEAFGTKVGVEKAELKRRKPLTMDGFQIYLMEEGIIMSIDHILANTGKRYDAYVSIISTIRRIIRDDQITGAMGGIYNGNITSRLNNLAEKQEVKVSDTFDVEMDLS